MSINSDTMLRIPLTQCADVALNQKLQITLVRCKLYTHLRFGFLNDINTISQSLKKSF